MNIGHVALDFKKSPSLVHYLPLTTSLLTRPPCLAASNLVLALLA